MPFPFFILQEAVNPSSDQSAASPTTHRLSIPRKALITTKAFGVDTSTVKKQLIQDLNNAVKCTEAIMFPLLLNLIKADM